MIQKHVAVPNNVFDGIIEQSHALKDDIEKAAAALEKIRQKFERKKDDQAGSPS
jgi:hypothetical protein